MSSRISDQDISKVASCISAADVHIIATQYLGLRQVEVDNINYAVRDNTFMLVFKCFLMWRNKNSGAGARKELVKILQACSAQGWLKIEDFKFLDNGTFEWPSAPAKGDTEGQLNQKLLQKVSKKVCTDQEMLDLGINLEIPMERIRSARTDNQSSINLAVMHMLYFDWFQEFKGTNQEALDTLKSALQESDLAVIIQDLNL